MSVKLRAICELSEPSARKVKENETLIDVGSGTMLRYRDNLSVKLRAISQQSDKSLAVIC